jgi:hypothetical protein
MHRCKHKSCIQNLPGNVLWSIVPVDSDRINRILGVVFRVEEFHDSCQIVGFSGRLTDQVDVV